jgi:hypothetical protein
LDVQPIRKFQHARDESLGTPRLSHKPLVWEEATADTSKIDMLKTDSAGTALSLQTSRLPSTETAVLLALKVEVLLG